MEGDGAAAIIAMASLPDRASTVIVSSPVKVAGRTAEIAVFVHEVICKICPVVEPAGVATTLQPIHCPLKPNPLMVIVEPALTTSGNVLNSGLIGVRIYGTTLQRTAVE